MVKNVQFDEIAAHPELANAARMLGATGCTWKQSFFGVSGELVAQRGEWRVSIPFQAGAAGGLNLGVNDRQPVTLPLFPPASCVLLGQAPDGRWLCEIDGVRAWATPLGR